MFTFMFMFVLLIFALALQVYTLRSSGKKKKKKKKKERKKRMDRFALNNPLEHSWNIYEVNQISTNNKNQQWVVLREAVLVRLIYVQLASFPKTTYNYLLGGLTVTPV